MTNPRIVILASGSGSIAQAIIDAQHSGEIKAEIAGVISDQAAARVLESSLAVPSAKGPQGTKLYEKHKTDQLV